MAAAASDPVAELDRLLDDDPYGEGIEALMAVAGDLLQTRGEQRGELIAHELASAAAGDPEILDGWLREHEAPLLGEMAWLRNRHGALAHTFRGGRVRELCLDLRRIDTRRVELSIAELLGILAKEQRVLRHLCSLRIRVRTSAELNEAARAVEQMFRAAPLEELVISTITRPLGHGPRVRLGELRKRFPLLWFATNEVGQLGSLLDEELADELVAHELSALGDRPISREQRVRIGRGLTSGMPATTRVAAELIGAAGGSGRVFLPALRLLLRPQVSARAAAAILPVVPSFGPWVVELRPLLKRITGSASRYPQVIRSLAGRALHELEQR